MMYWYDGHGAGWAWGQAGLMWLAVIVFWALLIWAVYALVTGVIRRGREQERGEQQPGGARRILDERLARGEIDPQPPRLHLFASFQRVYVGTERIAPVRREYGDRCPSVAG